MLLLTQGRWEADEIMCVISALCGSWNMEGAQEIIAVIIISYLFNSFIELL